MSPESTLKHTKESIIFNNVKARDWHIGKMSFAIKIL